MKETLPRMDVHLLGQFRVLQEDKDVSGFRSPKARALFALLVFANGNALEYEKLANDLWGEEEAEKKEEATPAWTAEQKRLKEKLSKEKRESALGRFRQCLTRVQGKSKEDDEKALYLDPNRFQKPKGRSWIALDLTNADVDVFQIETACTKGTFSDKQEAVRLYTGDLLPECPLREIATHRFRLQSQYRQLLETLIKETKFSGDFTLAAHYLRLRIASEPHKEEWREHLMDLYIHCGEENAAREVYHQYLHSLPIRTMPGPSLQAKFATIQITVLKPQSKLTIAPFATLPSPLPRLIGREKVVPEIEALLAEARFVTLKGPPGVGKTLLAQHVASRLSKAYNDEVAFVDLSAAKTLMDVQRRIVSCLGITLNASLSMEEMIPQAIGLHRVLLVLDNCEQILSETGPFLQDLLRKAPNLTILATSQMPWRTLMGEHVYHVRPLTLPPPRMLTRTAEGLLQALPHYEAINLFLKEVASIQPAIELTSRNAHVIARIVCHLDGLPLAIKLAAGTSHTLTPEQILPRLEHSLDILSDRLHSYPEKHRSMQAALRISYDLLPGNLQLLLQWLAVFRGGWTLEAAEALSKHKQIADALQQLQERSLVNAEAVEGAMRFTLLETVQRFMFDRLTETQQFASVCRWHLDYFLRMASEAEPYLTGPDQALWLRRLHPESANFRAALEWALESKEAEQGLRLANSLWRVFYASGNYEEGYHYLQKFLAVASDVEPLVCLKTHGAAGNLANARADYRNARLCFETSLELARSLEQPRTEASALGNLGGVLSLEGSYVEAEQLLQAGLEIYQRLGEERSIALILGNLAANASRAQDHIRAIDYSSQAVARLRDPGDPLNLAMALANLAGSLIADGQCLAALAAIAESLKLCAEIGQWRTIAQSHTLLLSMAVSQSAWSTAAQLLGMHHTVNGGMEFPLTSPEQQQFRDHRSAVERALGVEVFAEIVQQAATLEPEACIDFLLALCISRKDTLSEPSISPSLLKGGR